GRGPPGRVPTRVERAGAVPSATPGHAQVLGAPRGAPAILGGAMLKPATRVGLKPVTHRNAASPPGPVTSLQATNVTDTSVSLSWVNPTGPNFAGVMIRRAAGTTPPSSPTSGVLVATEASPGTSRPTTAGRTPSPPPPSSDLTPAPRPGLRPVAHRTAASPPGPVTSLQATSVTDTSVSLSWVNPTGPNFAGVMIRRAAGTTPPSSP